MIGREAFRARSASFLATANPVAVLGGAAALTIALFASLDSVTAAILVLLVTLSAPALGVPLSALASRGWPLLIAAVGIGAFTALFAAPAGEEPLVQVGPVNVTGGSLLVGAALALRLLGVALVGLVALAAVDPTRLADALIQVVRMPPRFAVGALAAFGLVPLFAREWEIIGLARRARGVEATSAWGAPREFAAKAHALLVSAIRRGERMATAMDARGFGSLPCRTNARVSRMRPRDWFLLAGACAVAAAATGTSVALGTWRFVLD